MLTNAAAKAAAPRARAYKLFDAQGLHLHVAPTGTKSWRLKFRRAGREQLVSLGRWPDLSLADARSAAQAERDRLRGGDQPAGDTFEHVARAWCAHRQSDWSPTHAADVIASLERHIFPAIGASVADAIEPPELLALLRAVERKGRIETARRIAQRLGEIFAFGIAEGRARRDQAEHLAAALRRAPLQRPQPALVTIGECRALLAACDRTGARSLTLLASRFLALTAVRLEAVRGARWNEIEDLDGVAPMWRVPAARMKLKRAKKGEARFDHLVPLAPAAVAVLREAAEIGYDAQGLIFPGRSADSPIGEGTIGELYDRAGYAGRHVPHGWRASFSTILNLDLGEEWQGAIDRALAHAAKDKVEAAYNRSVQLERRRAVFQRWGELLDPSAQRSPRCISEETRAVAGDTVNPG